MKTIQYKKQRYRLLSLMLILLMIVTLLGNTIPAYAQEGEPQANNGAPVVIANRAELEDAIQRAREAGVQLTENPTVSRTVTLGELDAAEQEIEQDYQQQIAAIEQAIALQAQYDEAFRQAKIASFERLIGSEWSFDELEAILQGDVTDVAVITAQDPSKMTLDVYRETAQGSYSKLTRIPQRNEMLVKGDMLHYGNVMQNPTDGRWVDLRITIEKMTDSAFYDENGQSVRDVSEEQFLNGNHNPNYGQEVNQVILRGPLNKTKIEFHYGDVDLTLKVEFLDHESQQAVELIPLLVFCDIDSYQAIQEGGQAVGSLTGSDLITLDNGAFRSNSYEDNLTNHRKHYAIYSLPQTSSFTYTFYDGAMSGVLQGVGGEHLPLPDPMREWATASYTFTNLFVETLLIATGSLMVTNTVSGSGGDQNKEFTFTVTLDQTDLSGTYGDMTFTNGVATFTLKHGESKTATGLPAGVSYTVEESNNSGYTVTKTNETGTIQTGSTVTAAFENYKGSSGNSGGSGGSSGGGDGGSNSHTPQVARVTLTATKTMDGLIPTGSGFTFFLNDANGQPLQTKNNHGANITFDTLTFNKTGTYVYYLTEQTGNDNNVNYDTASYKVTVTVTCPYDYAASVSYEKNGQVYNSVPAFANATKQADPAPAQTPPVITPACPLDKVPNTEDSSNLTLWGILAAASLLSLTALLAGTKARKVRSQGKGH